MAVLVLRNKGDNMIAYDTNGSTLFYTDASGQRVAAGYSETERYSTMLKTKGAQQQAVLDNTTVLSKYKAELAAVQGTYDQGRVGQNPDVPTVAPIKPAQKIVSDTGEVSYAPFVPPLSDLVISTKTVTSPNTTGLISSVTPAPVDTQALMFNMISIIFHKMFPDA